MNILITEKVLKVLKGLKGLDDLKVHGEGFEGIEGFNIDATTLDHTWPTKDTAPAEASKIGYQVEGSIYSIG